MSAVAADVSGDQDHLIDSVMHRLRLATPELFASPALEHALRTASAANLKRVHQLLLVPGESRSPSALPAETHDLTAACIRHGVPLAALLEAWRVGQAFVSDWWRHRVEERAQDQSALIAALDAIQLRISAFADFAAAAIRTTYEEERRAWEGTLSSRRARLVRDLLANQQPEPQRASAILNYPLDGWHTAGVLWQASRPEVETRPLSAATDYLSSCLGDVPLLSVPVSAQAVWIWTTVAIEPRQTKVLPESATLAIGSRLRGLSGFRRSHLEALDAQRIAMMGTRRRSSLVRYTDVEMAALMSRQPADMWWFIHRTLGPLARDEPLTETLRQTLAVYLETGFSTTATARKLHAYRNTVSYRINQISELVGADYQARAIELAVALKLVAAAGLLPHGWEHHEALPSHRSTPDS